MLDHDERRQLGHIETWLRIGDPAFAEGLRTGQPRRPREYRRWPALIPLGAGLAVIAVAILTGLLLAALPGLAGVLAAARFWLRRRLDGPARFPSRRRGRLT